MAVRGGPVSLRVRICTRLAWLDVTKTEFAMAISMDKSVFSRVLRADSPHRKTLERISKGLGLEVEELLGDQVSLLLSPHPALSGSMTRDDRVEALMKWVEEP